MTHRLDENEADALRAQLEAVTKERDGAQFALGNAEAARDAARKERDEQRDRVAEYDHLIGLQRARSREADRLWQEAHGKLDVWPDLGEVLEWLMSTRAKLEKERDDHREGADAWFARAKAALRERDALAARVAQLEGVLEPTAENVRELSDAIEGQWSTRGARASWLFRWFLRRAGLDGKEGNRG